MNLPTAVAVAVTLALPALLPLGVLLGIRRKRARLRRLTATGTATVVATKTTSRAVAHQPVVKCRMLLAFGDHGKTRELELKIAVHPLDDERVQVGTVFPLRFEPAELANFSIDFGGKTGVELSDL
jgi:hypothetical protein